MTWTFVSGKIGFDSGELGFDSAIRLTRMLTCIILTVPFTGVFVPGGGAELGVIKLKAENKERKIKKLDFKTRDYVLICRRRVAK